MRTRETGLYKPVGSNQRLKGAQTIYGKTGGITDCTEPGGRPRRFWTYAVTGYVTINCPFPAYPVPDYKYSSITDDDLVPIKYVTKRVSREVYDFSKFTKHDWYLHRMMRKPSLPMKIVHYNIQVPIKDKSRPMKFVDHIKKSRWVIGEFVFTQAPPSQRTVKCPLPCADRYIQQRCYQISPISGGSHVPYRKFGNPSTHYLTYVRKETYHDCTAGEAMAAISRGLPKIAGFTFETEANMLVTMLEIRSMFALFSPILRAAGPLGRAASVFLGYNFAVAPTIGDYNTMLEMSEKINAAINDWNSKAGKPRFFHYKFREEKHSFSESLSPNPAYDVKIMKEVRHKAHATISIVGERIVVPQSVVKIRQMGFDKPLSALWEMIPFSFIIDWFTDISGFLSQFETTASPAKFKILDACYSQKTQIFTSLSSIKNTDARTGYQLSFPTIYEEESYYTRVPIDVDLLNDIELMRTLRAWRPSNRFGGKQALLLVALGIVLRPSLRR